MLGVGAPAITPPPWRSTTTTFQEARHHAENPTDSFASSRDKSPEDAAFYWNGGPIEVAERTWFVSEFSGVTAFETDEGIVLVDSGLVFLAPRIAEALRSVTEAPIHTAIFTHGHVDHAYGLAALSLIHI